MRVGFFRRVGSYLLDLLPILGVLSLLSQFLLGGLLQPDNYDAMMDEYNDITASYNELFGDYQTQLQNDEITQTEYELLYNTLVEDYNAETQEHVQVFFVYYQNLFIYMLASSTLIYYLYNVFTKGHTLGRRIMKIELDGHITWWTLLVREVIWKAGYYMLTFLVVGVLIDFISITLTSKKKAPRDYVTGITVKYEGVNYPF